MLGFLRRQWILVCIAVLACGWLIAFPLWSQWVTAEPLRAPILLAPAGSVEANIQIRVAETHSLSFLFERDGIPFANLQAIIGAMGMCKVGEVCSKGVPVPISWSLAPRGQDKLVAAGDTVTSDSTGWSQEHVYRLISRVRVPPGQYVFKAEVLRPVPELSGVRTSIALQIEPKATSTWQLGLVWWGTAATYLVVLPVAVCLGGVLVWRAGLTLRSSRRATADAVARG